MQIVTTELLGLFTVDIERIEDDRGYFARSFCEREFSRLGLPTRFPQSNVSFNRHRGTLRGMHFQAEPYPEAKLVRCTRGRIYDVALDLRPDSPTYCRWLGFELTEENSLALFIPAGFAHGFVTLASDSEVLYSMGAEYHPELARGVRWDDPAFNITWPVGAPVLSDRDAGYPDFVP